MRRARRVGLALAATALLAAGGWLVGHRSVDGAGPTADEPATVTAQVRSERPVRRRLTETLVAFGEAASGQIIGLSFPLAGQVTRLSALAGTHVARGEVLAMLAPDPATRSAYAQAVHAADAARREQARTQELSTLQLATQAQVDAASKAAQDAADALGALQAVGGGSTASVVKAPFDGVVLSLAAAQGDRVVAGAPILQFGRSDTLRLQFGIEPADSRQVRVGAAASLTLVGARDAAAVIRAQISEVQDAVDPKTQLVNAVVVLHPPAAEAIALGTKVRAVIDVGPPRDSVTVAASAVLTDERGGYVFQVVDGRAHRVPVVAGTQASGVVAVSGLRDLQAPVVVLGNYELQDGMAVREAQR